MEDTGATFWTNDAERGDLICATHWSIDTDWVDSRVAATIVGQRMMNRTSLTRVSAAFVVSVVLTASKGLQAVAELASVVNATVKGLVGAA